MRFLPQTAAFESVAAQIKAGTAAYSVYALARLFLQKPERYDVRVKTKEHAVLFRLGDSGTIATDRIALENSAFRALKEKYYTVNVTLNEPIKGDFASVARERTTGKLFGPTNHHDYQPQLRRFYEQRFSRRISFGDFQRQIEIVNDPALVEQWKEQARKVTTFTTLQEEPAHIFHNEAEAERHFREKYLPSLVTETAEAEIDGVTSRTLPDRGIARVIEDAWSREVGSPSNMMQELAGRLRGAGLQIFRHRKGMLFVSPIRPKPIDETAVSDSARPILETLKVSPRVNRKDLAEKLIASDANAEAAKLSLASDLHWLIREGRVIEFNDGSLDLPRAKPPEKKPAEATAVPSDASTATNDVATADGVAALTPSSAEEPESPGSLAAAVPSGTEMSSQPGTADHQEGAEDSPLETAAAREDAKIPPPETAASISSVGSTESRPTNPEN